MKQFWLHVRIDSVHVTCTALFPCVCSFLSFLDIWDLDTLVGCLGLWPLLKKWKVFHSNWHLSLFKFSCDFFVLVKLCSVVWNYILCTVILKFQFFLLLTESESSFVGCCRNIFFLCSFTNVLYHSVKMVPLPLKEDENKQEPLFSS